MEVLISLIKLLLKIFSPIWKKVSNINSVVRLSLSKEEKDILKGATKEIYRLVTDQTGEFIRAGKENFYFENDLEKTTKYNEALDSLIKKELVVYKSGQLFELTGKGYKISKKFK